MPNNDLVRVPLKLRKSQVIRLNLLLAALSEKMGKEMTLSKIIETIIDDFLDSK